MAATDILKEYLVKLGFSVDSSAQMKIRQALGEIEKQLDKLASNKSAKVLTHGMLAYAGAIGTVIAATGAMAAKVANADMEYQKLALRMHMTKDAAKAVTIAQKALNASLEEIAWIPELRAQYKELKGIVQSTSPDSAALKQIRSIMFEFTKMKVIIGQGMEWIVYHLANVFGGSLEGAKNKLSDITKWLKDNIQVWTKWIAGGITVVINVVRAAYEIGKKLYGLVKDFINYLPTGVGAIIAFGAAIAGAFMLNPVIASLTLLFGLLHEWWVWSEGKKHGYKTYTIFGGMFEGLSDLFAPLKELKNVMGDVLNPGGDFSWWKTFVFLLDNVKKSIIELIGGIGLLFTAFQIATQIGGPKTGTPEQEAKHREVLKKLEKTYDLTKAGSKREAEENYESWMKAKAREDLRYSKEIGAEDWKGKVGERMNKFVSMTFDTDTYVADQRRKRKEVLDREFKSGEVRATGAQIRKTPSKVDKRVPPYTTDMMTQEEKTKYDAALKAVGLESGGKYPPVVEETATGLRGYDVRIENANIYALNFDDVVEKMKQLAKNKVAGMGG
jgi:hypothetical protein